MNKQVSKVPVDRVARPLWRALALVVLSQVGCPDGCGPRQLVRVEVAGDGAGHVYDPLGRWGACFAETSIADHAYDETTPCLISFHPQADGPRKFAAFADPDSRFVGWSGDCVAELGSETVSTIELGTTTDYRCVATFEAETGGAGGSGGGGATAARAAKATAAVAAMAAVAAATRGARAGSRSRTRPSRSRCSCPVARWHRHCHGPATSRTP